MPLELVTGIVVLMIMFVIASSADMNSAEEQLTTNVEYMKEQCNNSQMRDLASEAKSLLRVTESVEQIRWRLRYGIYESDAAGEPDKETLEGFAGDLYLAGLILLDSEGNKIASYDPVGFTPEGILKKVDTESLMDVVDFTEKTYAVRINFENESHIDLAAVGRADEKGVIIGYYYTSSEYARTFNNSIRSLVSGYKPEHDGTIVVSSGNRIIASNDSSLVGRNTGDIPILSYIMEVGTSKKLVHRRASSMSMTSDFGLMDKSQNYYIYAYMSERNVFATTPRNMLYALFVYALLIGLLNMMWWRADQTYREKQAEIRQKYTEDLEAKNIQLVETAAQAEKANAAKSNFLSRMSHDIRTPLNGIIGLLKIDEAHFEDRELVRENHRKMLISADHLLSLINDVLQMSKLEDGKIELTHEIVDLAKLSMEVGTIISSRTAEAGITLEVEKQELPVRYVYGSPLHLRQIFLNIYGNCIKYNKVGGKVTTTGECFRTDDNTVTYRWIISDTGIGMSEEFLKHIFDPFSQEHSDARSVYMGTGLGMTIVSGLVEKMNGTIDVTSQEGSGTTFIVTIPFEIAAEPTIEENENGGSEEQAPEKADLDGLKLMLVEDNELNAEIAQMLLEDEGASVTLVSDGQQAVDMFSESTAGDFDAILMDIMMPVMDGLTATRTIRALERPDAAKIPIIAMTANAFEEDAKKCLAAGMNAHLAKPLQITKVVAEINRFCRK